VIAINFVTVGVDREAPVCVSVVSDSHIGTRFANRLLKERQVR
jgi:hypothetical protein